MTGKFEDWAHSLPDKFLLCRDTALKHDYRELDATWNPNTRTYTRVFRCRRCRTKAIYTLDSGGYIIHRRMDYTEAEGYLSPNGRVTADDNAAIRLMLINRSMEGK